MNEKGFFNKGEQVEKDEPKTLTFPLKYFILFLVLVWLNGRAAVS